MANLAHIVGGIALCALSAAPLSPALAQTTPAKPPVDLVCCYGEKPQCEAFCPIMDADQREQCLRECEGKLRACLSQGVFAAQQGGKDVVCLPRPPGAPPGR